MTDRSLPCVNTRRDGCTYQEVILAPSASKPIVGNDTNCSGERTNLSDSTRIICTCTLSVYLYSQMDLGGCNIKSPHPVLTAAYDKQTRSKPKTRESSILTHFDTPSTSQRRQLGTHDRCSIRRRSEEPANNGRSVNPVLTVLARPVYSAGAKPAATNPRLFSRSYYQHAHSAPYGVGRPRGDDSSGNDHNRQPRPEYSLLGPVGQ